MTMRYFTSSRFPVSSGIRAGVSSMAPPGSNSLTLHLASGRHDGWFVDEANNVATSARSVPRVHCVEAVLLSQDKSPMSQMNSVVEA